MPIFKLLAGTAVLSAALAAPAPAQPIISEPGYCAFYYPNANCQNKGPGNPYTDPNYNSGQNPRAWSSGETVGVAGKRARMRQSTSPAMRMQ